MEGETAVKKTGTRLFLAVGLVLIFTLAMWANNNPPLPTNDPSIPCGGSGPCYWNPGAGYCYGNDGLCDCVTVC